MKGTLDRTKVVLRHLPPAISQETLLELIDGSFAGRYNWVSFCPGKNSHKHPSYSRAYINFNKPEDVVEFAEFFNGHNFVNEKGTQFKAIVEYSPSQRVPKQCLKNDGREGTIYEDSDYLEFLDHLAKPVKNLPSAEIQLERREAEQSGSLKDIPIVTPLMDFVRQKREATKESYRRTSSVGKLNRRASLSSTGSPGSASLRRGSEKKRAPTKLHFMRDGTKSDKVSTKSTYILVCKGKDRHVSNDSNTLSSAAGSEILGEEIGSAGNGAGKKKVLLLRGKEREILNGANGPLEDKATVNSRSERQENRKWQRPDRGVWTQRPNGIPAGPNTLGRRGHAHGTKSNDAYSTPTGKHSRRGGPPGHSLHEKQVWVQKSSTDS